MKTKTPAYYIQKFYHELKILISDFNLIIAWLCHWITSAHTLNFFLETIAEVGYWQSINASLNTADLLRHYSKCSKWSHFLFLRASIQSIWVCKIFDKFHVCFYYLLSYFPYITLHWKVVNGILLIVLNAWSQYSLRHFG